MLKKAVVFFILFSFAFSIFSVNVSAQAPTVSAKSAVVICADNGKILYSKNENEKLSMASTTKIMTALLTLEAADADNKSVTITDQMVAVEGSSMGLHVGDVVTLDTLAKGMLLCSGNDAANAAALALEDSLEHFADRMNEKAAQIGMKNTHFVTPSGLDDELHYSTAYDMALLGAYAMENESFAAIASEKSMQVSFINPDKRVTLGNHNKLLSAYKGCIGVKTGFTTKSGRCLVSCAEQNGIRLIAVTLNAPDDWNDHENMLNYAFTQATAKQFGGSELTLPVVGGDTAEIALAENNTVNTAVPVTDADKIQQVIELPQFIYAPVRKGQLVGKIYYKTEDTIFGVTDLVAQQDVNIIPMQRNIFEKILDFFKNIF